MSDGASANPRPPHSQPSRGHSRVNDSERPDDGHPVYQPSTNEDFVREVTSVAAASCPALDGSASGEPPGLPATTFGISSSAPPPASCDLRDLVLPPRQLADNLLHWYWGFIHPLTPVAA